MKKIFVFLICIPLIGCGRLTSLLDTAAQNQQLQNQKLKQELSPTQNSQQPPATPVNINVNVNVNVNQPQQSQNQLQHYIAPEIQVLLTNHYDATVSWNDVGANSYTVFRCWDFPQDNASWMEIATVQGFNMVFKDAYYSGTHYYRVRANFDEGIVKTSTYKPLILHP